MAIPPVRTLSDPGKLKVVKKSIEGHARLAAMLAMTSALARATAPMRDVSWP